MPDYRPTHEDLKAFRAERKSLFSALHTEMDIDEIFMLASSVWKSGELEPYLHGLPKEGFRAKIPPIARNGVSIARNQVMVGETPKVSVLLPESRIDPIKRTKQRESLERKFQALLWYIDTYSVEPPLLTFMDHCIGLGRGVLAYPVNPRWQDDPFTLRNGKRKTNLTAVERVRLRRWEEARTRALPWDVRAINPHRVLWDPHNDPPEDVILVEQESYHNIARRYPHLEGPLGQDRISAIDRMGELVTYCSAEFYGVWFEDQPLLQSKRHKASEDGVAENTSGIMWFKFADSGFGQNTFEGNWEHRIKGILRDARDTIATYIVAFNQIETMRGVNAFPPMDISAPTQEEADEAASRFQYGPAAKFPHGPGVSAQPMQLPNIPQAAFETINHCKEFLEAWFGPHILIGAYDADPTSSQHERRLNQAKAPLKPATQGGQQAVAAMLMDLAYQIKHDLDGPITVMNAQNGIETIHPEDVVDGMRIMIDFTPPTKDQLEQDANALNQRLQLDLVSRHRVMEADPEIDDVDDEQSTIDAEKLKQSEPVLQVMAEATANLLRQELEAKGLLPPAAPAAPSSPPPSPGMEEAMPPAAPEMGPAGMPEQMAPQPAPPMAPQPSLNGAGSPFGAVPGGPVPGGF